MYSARITIVSPAGSTPVLQLGHSLTSDRQGSCAHCRRTDVQLYPLNDPSRIPPRLLQRFQPTERHAHAAQSALENLTVRHPGYYWLICRFKIGSSPFSRVGTSRGSRILRCVRVTNVEIYLTSQRTMDEAALSIEAVKASDSDLRKSVQLGQMTT